MTVQLSDYELERQERIEANKRRIMELGLLEGRGGVDDGAGPSQKAKKPRAPKASQQPPLDGEELERRVSKRDLPKVSYRDDDYYGDLPRLPRAPRAPRIVDDEEVEKLRGLHGTQQAATKVGEEGDEEGRKGGRAPIDSGKGVRLQGGRVYDSAFGVTCHWCRQKTLENHVTCTSACCGKGKRLATTFCKMCLKNRHGEDVDAAHASGKWVCPQCRGNCGAGCLQCCNCGPCRKKGGLEPTKQLAKTAKAAGFDDVHDYLVHLVTAETPEQITARKTTFKWGRWMLPDGGAALDAEDAAAAAAAGPVVEVEAPPAAADKVKAKRKRASKATATADDPTATADPSPAAADITAAPPKKRAKKVIGDSVAASEPAPVTTSAEKQVGQGQEAEGMDLLAAVASAAAPAAAAAGKSKGRGKKGDALVAVTAAASASAAAVAGTKSRGGRKKNGDEALAAAAAIAVPAMAAYAAVSGAPAAVTAKKGGGRKTALKPSAASASDDAPAAAVTTAAVTAAAATAEAGSAGAGTAAGIQPASDTTSVAPAAVKRGRGGKKAVLPANTAAGPAAAGAACAPTVAAVTAVTVGDSSAEAEQSAAGSLTAAVEGAQLAASPVAENGGDKTHADATAAVVASAEAAVETAATSSHAATEPAAAGVPALGSAQAPSPAGSKNRQSKAVKPVTVGTRRSARGSPAKAPAPTESGCLRSAATAKDVDDLPLQPAQETDAVATAHVATADATAPHAVELIGIAPVVTAAEANTAAVIDVAAVAATTFQTSPSVSGGSGTGSQSEPSSSQEAEATLQLLSSAVEVVGVSEGASAAATWKQHLLVPTALVSSQEEEGTQQQLSLPITASADLGADAAAARRKQRILASMGLSSSQSCY